MNRKHNPILQQCRIHSFTFPWQLPPLQPEDFSSSRSFLSRGPAQHSDSGLPSEEGELSSIYLWLDAKFSEEVAFRSPRDPFGTLPQQRKLMQNAEPGARRRHSRYDHDSRNTQRRSPKQSTIVMVQLLSWHILLVSWAGLLLDNWCLVDLQAHDCMLTKALLYTHNLVVISLYTVGF